MSRWFTGRFYGMTPLRANLRTANTISWKVKLILHYCGLWQHQRHTCGNCNNAVTTDGDWCKSCLAQSREWNSQFPNGPLKRGR